MSDFNRTDNFIYLVLCGFVLGFTLSCALWRYENDKPVVLAVGVLLLVITSLASNFILNKDA